MAGAITLQGPHQVAICTEREGLVLAISYFRLALIKGDESLRARDLEGLSLSKAWESGCRRKRGGE